MSISVNCLSGFQYINFSMLFPFVAAIVYGFSFFRALFAFQVGQKCRFFQQHDDEIYDRGKVLLPQQRQRIITLEAEVTDCKKREVFSCGCGIVSGDMCSSVFDQVGGGNNFCGLLWLVVDVRLAVCLILVGLIINNDTSAAYFVLFML